MNIHSGSLPRIRNSSILSLIILSGQYFPLILLCIPMQIKKGKSEKHCFASNDKAKSEKVNLTFMHKTISDLRPPASDLRLQIPRNLLPLSGNLDLYSIHHEIPVHEKISYQLFNSSDYSGSLVMLDRAHGWRRQRCPGFTHRLDCQTG